MTFFTCFTILSALPEKGVSEISRDRSQRRRISGKKRSFRLRTARGLIKKADAGQQQAGPLEMEAARCDTPRGVVIFTVAPLDRNQRTDRAETRQRMIQLSRPSLVTGVRSPRFALDYKRGYSWPRPRHRPRVFTKRAAPLDKNCRTARQSTSIRHCVLPVSMAAYASHP